MFGLLLSLAIYAAMCLGDLRGLLRVRAAATIASGSRCSVVLEFPTRLNGFAPVMASLSSACS